MRLKAGFTLIEILIVVAIIAVLATLLIPAVGLLRNAAKSATTDKTMQSICTALSLYLGDHGRIGASAGIVDGATVPLSDVLGRVIAGKPALLELRPDMVDEEGRIVDGFRRGILYAAENATKYGRIHTARMVITSQGPDEGDPTDDMVYLLTVTEGGWKRLSGDAIPVAGLDPK